MIQQWILQFKRLYTFACIISGFLFGFDLRSQIVLPKEVNDSLTFYISQESLMRDLHFLASDTCAGRETGTTGIDVAAQYITGKIQEVGVRPLKQSGSYFQHCYFYSAKWKGKNLSIHGKQLEYQSEYVPLMNEGGELDSAQIQQVTFAGFGIRDHKYNDYHGLNVQGKTIVIWDGEPRSMETGKFWISQDSTPSAWTQNRKKKFYLAAELGAKRIILLVKPDQLEEEMKNQGTGRAMKPGVKEELSSPIPVYFLREDLAYLFFGNSPKKKDFLKWKLASFPDNRPPKNIQFTKKAFLQCYANKDIKSIEDKNILAFLPGSDPLLSREIVIVSAHYDHLGKRGGDIYYGADDNGSGTAALLSMIQAFSRLQENGFHTARSVLFMFCTGEEKGLLGSSFYVRQPIFPLEQTIANVNTDMIGRIDEKHKDNPNYIYVIGSDFLSTDLHQWNEAVNSQYSKLELDYTYNSKKDPNRYYYRSDHYNFAKNKIPSVFFFNGTHPDYHRPTDTVDKIHFGKVEKITQHIARLVWVLANQPKRPVVDKNDSPDK